MKHGAIILTLGAMLALPAHAITPRDPLIEGARQCTQQFPQQERAQRIPLHLLAAISSTESGRWHDGLRMALPWPWTINVEGKGYYFNTKAEAVAKTEELLAAGKRSIDVGCMQVNLRHHPRAFASLNAAFDPASNVAYAAKFLRTNYDDLGDWIKATAAYHSRTPKYGNAYLTRIERAWNTIVGRVQKAQGAPVETSGYRVITPEDSGPVFAKRLTPENGIASTRNVKVISVKEAPRHSLLVVSARPEPNTTGPVVATLAPMRDEMLVMGGGNAAGSVDKPAASGNMRQQPNFVFVH